jgi:hypothetical protein
MRPLAATVISTSLLLPVSVLADPPRPVAPRTSGDGVRRGPPATRAMKTRVLDMPAEDVGGTTVVPDDVDVRILSLGKAGTLIRVRRDFIPEIVQTADDL